MSLSHITLLFAVFLISLLLCLLIVWSEDFHGTLSHDSTVGIQKTHVRLVPRIGGAAIFFSCIVGYVFSEGDSSSILSAMLVGGTPIFFIGMAEDLLKNVSIRLRLFFTAVGSTLFIISSGALIRSIEVPQIDPIFGFVTVSYLFTIFSIVGVVNSINMVDGAHGLASGTAVICLSSLLFIGIQTGDQQLVLTLTILICSILGFILVNYPSGIIFLGDGGSYLLGFLLAASGLELTNRNSGVSSWAVLLVCAYPITETIFSISRRFITGYNPMFPDDAHLHGLVRVFLSSRWRNPPTLLLNGMIAPVLWILACIPSTVGVLFFDSTLICASFFILYVVIYICSYVLIKRGVSH